MPDRPHIVLIMADHLRFDCLSCYGSLGVDTPHLDALADEAVIFENAYCSTPLCVPTRTSLACGKWPHTTRTLVNGGSFPEEHPYRGLGPEHRTFYEQISDAGYGITHVGIQHIRSDPPLVERVPDADICTDATNEEHLASLGFEPPRNDDVRMPTPEWINGRPAAVKMYHVPTHVERTEFGAEHFMDVYWSRCMERRIRKANVANPHAFILQLWAPHPPFFVPEPYFSMYDPEAIDLPETVARWYDGMPPTYLLGTGGFRGAQILRDDWRKTWAGYFGLVTMVDDCVGRVVNALKERGIWDDSLAIFTQDHGESLGCHCMFQKMTVYEESAHIPLLIKPPKGTPARRKQMAGHVDIAPTICDYAGAAPPPGTWGSSLRSVIDDNSAPWREATFSEFNGDHGRAYPVRAVMTERYKYVHHFAAKDELYDLHEDPNETRSLIDAPDHAERCANMLQMLRDWMAETDDVLDIDRDADFTPRDWNHIDCTPGRKLP